MSKNKCDRKELHLELTAHYNQEWKPFLSEIITGNLSLQLAKELKSMELHHVSFPHWWYFKMILSASKVTATVYGL